MRIRNATRNDAALLAEHRAAVWHEVGDWGVADLAPQIPVWTTFFAERLADGTYLAYIAEEQGDAIGSGGVLVHPTIPRPGLQSDRAGRVQSVYVVPPARRKGVARAIMEQLVELARAAKFVTLTLHPSDEARPLYTTLGFKAADEMILALHPNRTPGATHN